MMADVFVDVINDDIIVARNERYNKNNRWPIDCVSCNSVIVTRRSINRADILAQNNSILDVMMTVSINSI